MAYWLDYSAAKLTGATIKAAGYTGVIRYIDAPNLLATKHTNLDEYRSHIAAGLTVLLVHQGTTTDADSGFQGGVNRATRAKAGADYLGYKGVIFFTNDRTTVPNVAAWQAYLDGAASVLGKARVGAYGFNNALNAAVGHASAFWQAGRKSDLVPHANYWQDNNTQVTVGGITCDRNLVIKAIGPSAMAGFDSSDFTTMFYNNPIQKFGNLSQLLADIVTNVEASTATVNAVKSDVAAVKASVAALQTSGVDVQALAAALTPLMQPGLDPAAIAKAVSDEIDRRMDS